MLLGQIRDANLILAEMSYAMIGQKSQKSCGANSLYGKSIAFFEWELGGRSNELRSPNEVESSARTSHVFTET
ncbi:hypothetical protein Plhal304r1_c053g0137411 [Plasmopara halstedii]